MQIKLARRFICLIDEVLVLVLLSNKVVEPLIIQNLILQQSSRFNYLSVYSLVAGEGRHTLDIPFGPVNIVGIFPSTQSQIYAISLILKQGLGLGSEQDLLWPLSDLNQCEFRLVICGKCGINVWQRSANIRTPGLLRRLIQGRNKGNEKFGF